MQIDLSFDFKTVQEVEKIITNPILLTYKSSINHRSKLESTLYPALKL